MQEATIAAIRFGYGLRAAPQPASVGEILNSLAAPDPMPRRYPTVSRAKGAELLSQIRAARQARKDGGAKAQDALAAAQDRVRRIPNALLRTTLARISDSPSPMRERLTAFWMDHFTVALRRDTTRALIGSYVDDAVRPNVTGRFADLLRAAVTHPAMLIYLDQVSSVGPGSKAGGKKKAGLNENLAREVLELHTLGVAGSYSQADVRQFAELLTGLSFRLQQEPATFFPELAEPGAEEILGRSYGSGRAAKIGFIDAFLEDLAMHPDTVRHVSTKLATHFVSDKPGASLIDHMIAAWTASGGDLMQVYAALMEHPEARATLGGKAKQPFDFIASGLLALGMTGADISGWNGKLFRQAVLIPMDRMGQRFMRPNGPDGWSEDAETWITPLGIAQRIRWGQQVPKTLIKGPLPDPRNFVHTALGDAAGERLIWAVGASETVPQGLGLIFASPEFNRR